MVRGSSGELALPLADALGGDLPELHGAEGRAEVPPEERPITLTCSRTQRPALHQSVLDPALGVDGEEALTPGRIRDEPGELFPFHLLNRPGSDGDSVSLIQS